MTSKLDPDLAPDEAREAVLALRAWNPLDPGLDLLKDARSIQDRYDPSFWDALIVASARRLDCGVLLTEDLQDGRDLDGLLVRSPSTHPPT